jgi:hypothetical protein
MELLAEKRSEIVEKNFTGGNNVAHKWKKSRKKTKRKISLTSGTCSKLSSPFCLDTPSDLLEGEDEA